MAEEFANKIKRLELENFTCFGKVAMDFSPGINVFIGENGTGKTHLLKVLYAVEFGGLKVPLENGAMTNEDYLFDKSKVESVFGITDSTNLIKSNSGASHFKIKIDSKIKDKDYNALISAIEQFLFIPTQEMLSWQEHFIGNNYNRESGFDKTWFDLAFALDRGILGKGALEDAEKLFYQLEEAISAKILKRDKKFYFHFFNNGQTEQEASIVATGINKLAQLIYLIMNGSLTKETTLFWDEPEANLNPKYILVVSKFLQTLAKAGCQIFVATHDYLLPYDLSLSKEYQEVEGDVPDMKFFSLYKGENGTEVEEGATMSDLNHDPIHEGLSKHNQREDILFRKSLNPQA
jgi:predicted ATPase